MDFDRHIDDVAERARQNFYSSFNNPLYGLEAEDIHLMEDFSAADNSNFPLTLKNAAELGEGRISSSPGIESVPKAAVFEGSPEAHGRPAITYDYGPQVEIETQAFPGLSGLVEQKRSLESIARESVPGGTVLHQLALLPSLQFDNRDFDDPFGWDRHWNGESAGYRNPVLRYGDIEAAYGEPAIVMGGAGSIQFSAVPGAEPGLETVDDTVLDFIGAGEMPGMPALNPVFYGLTDASGRIDEGGLDVFHARDDTYVERHCRSEFITEEEGRAKFGYIEDVLEGDLREMDSLEDLARDNAEKLLEYTARAPLENFRPADGGPRLHEREDYSHYDGSDSFSLVLVGEGLEAVTHRDVVENEELEGYLRLETQDGQVEREDALLDVGQLSNPEEFLWRNYLQAESMNKPNIRPRLGYGCFENRDADNSPWWLETVGIQAAKMRRWDEFQEAAMEEGFQNSDALYLREQQRQRGLDGYLHPDTDTTIREFVADNREIFSDALYEPEIRTATLSYLDDITGGGKTFSEEASEIEDDFETFMRRSKA